MDFQKLQNRQIIRVQKLWNITRRQALEQARMLLQTGLEYVDVLESQLNKKAVQSTKNPAKLTAKKPLKAYVERLNKPAQVSSQSDAIRMHKQTVRHH